MVRFQSPHPMYISTALTAATASHISSTTRIALFIVNGYFSLDFKNPVIVKFLICLKSNTLDVLTFCFNDHFMIRVQAFFFFYPKIEAP